jgi:hypothetical protein
MTLKLYIHSDFQKIYKFFVYFLWIFFYFTWMDECPPGRFLCLYTFPTEFITNDVYGVLVFLGMNIFRLFHKNQSSSDILRATTSKLVQVSLSYEFFKSWKVTPEKFKNFKVSGLSRVIMFTQEIIKKTFEKVVNILKITVNAAKKITRK